MDTIEELLEEQLKDLYSAETQLTKAMPKVIKKASNPALKKAFESHMNETLNQITRLQTIGDEMDIKLTGKTCAAMKGLIEECKEVLEEDGEEAIIDIALVAAVQRVEHYEIAGYGTVRALAEHLGHAKVAKLLGDTLKEESAADEKLTAVTKKNLLPEAMQMSAK